MESDFLLWLSRLRTRHTVHEDERLNPGLTQGVKDLSLLHLHHRLQMQLRSYIVVAAM